MRTFLRIFSAFFVLVFTSQAIAAGLLKPIASDLPSLKIKTHHVNVVVDGSFITTSIEQVFHNPTTETLEAIYSFPVPEHAAVGEFIYWINDQAVVGEVIEKQQAREIYQQEKQAGREAALVEKDEYRTFDIHVTPVLPQSDVKIKLSYVQNAYVDSSVGRYVYPLEDGGIDELKSAFWQRNEVVEEAFSFTFHLRSGYPVEALRLPKHDQAAVEKISDQEWRVSFINKRRDAFDAYERSNFLDENNANIKSITLETDQGISIGEEAPSTLPAENLINLNKDIVVYWRLKQGIPAGMDLLTYKENKNSKGTFLLTLTPGEDLAQVEQGRDWLFVLDVSGSMRGKYATLVEGVRQAITKLPQADRFRVIVFNEQAHDLTRGYQNVNGTEVTTLLRRVAEYTPGGGTNLYAGLELALKQLNADRPSAVVLVTDGVANVGVTQKQQFLKLIHKRDLRLYTFIMGNSANRPLLEEMTNVSNGFALSISNSDDIVGQVMLAASKLSHHAMRDINIKFSGVKTANVVSNTSSSIYRGEQIVIIGHYFGSGELGISIDAKVAGEQKQYHSKALLPSADDSYPEIERLWGYAHIKQLQSELDYFGADLDLKKALIDTAIEYGLVTDFTSMIVLRDEVFAAYNIARQNSQRIEKELRAKSVRSMGDVSKQKVNEQAPMFSGDRRSLGSNSGGGGAFNGTFLLAALLLCFFRRVFRKV